MTKAPSYYRARVEAINKALAFENMKPESRDREMRIAYLRNGFVPDRFMHNGSIADIPSVYSFVDGDKRYTIDQYANDHSHEQQNGPLTDDELAQYDTWFQIHPEKVCGTQVGGTGYSFPVKTVGTPDDIIKAIDRTLSSHRIDTDQPQVRQDDELLEEILEAEAIALQLLQEQALALLEI